MSWYTVGEILLWLLIAAVLGFIIGWLLRTIIPSAGKDAERIAELERQLEASKQKNRAHSERNNKEVPEPLESEPTKPSLGSALPAGTKVKPAGSPEAAAARAKVAEIAARTSRGATAIQRDDLQLIHGVGPVISNILYSLGITSFAQVARFDADDIEVVGEALEVFPDRMLRDDWIGSARTLHREKYGSDPLQDA